MLNEPKLKQDLENNWAVVAGSDPDDPEEENYPQPYGALKESDPEEKID